MGARRRRQGTGEWVARAFHRSGHDIVGIVGTTEETLATARRALFDRHGIRAAGYLSLDDLLRERRPDIVAVCTPPRTHLSLVRTALAAGCHVFCEKPLAWDTATEWPTRPGFLHDEVEALPAMAATTLLELNTQWPWTLDSFHLLHPGLSSHTAPERFEMWLSPATEGTRMVLDSVSHPLSMLRRLCGAGRLGAIWAAFTPGPDGRLTRLDLGFDYLHETGRTRVESRLARCATPPRPAGYAIDGHRAERAIELPEYRLTLNDGGRRVVCPDPLVARVDDFLTGLAAGRSTDGQALVADHAMLCQLVAAAAAEERKYDQGAFGAG